MVKKRRLLVLDDDPDIGEFIRDVALESGYDASASHQPAEFSLLYSDDIDVIVLDLLMPGMDGIELLRYLAKQSSHASIILISGYDASVLHSAEELAAAHHLRVVATLTKPIHYKKLKSILQETQPVLPRIPAQAVNDVPEPTADELSRALEGDGEIVLYYQPLFDMHRVELIGVEALIRWQHPQCGLLGPSIILSLAEQSGQLDKLTCLVLQQALRQAGVWLQAGLDIQVAVNMPADCIKDLSLPEWLEALLVRYRLKPEQIIIEVTESGLMTELMTSLDILTRLRMKGITLAIDDFGTGYSSLVQLFRIPFGKMKVDCSFVMHATHNEEALAIVKMTIMLAHELGMVVVAEGIENRQTWELLCSLGCDIGQGYYIARPMPADDLLQWHQARLAPVMQKT